MIQKQSWIAHCHFKKNRTGTFLCNFFKKNRTGTFLCNFFAKSIVSTTVVIYSLTGVDMYDPGKKKAY